MITPMDIQDALQNAETELLQAELIMRQLSNTMLSNGTVAQQRDAQRILRQHDKIGVMKRRLFTVRLKYQDQTL